MKNVKKIEFVDKRDKKNSTPNFGKILINNVGVSKFIETKTSEYFEKIFDDSYFDSFEAFLKKLGKIEGFYEDMLHSNTKQDLLYDKLLAYYKLKVFHKHFSVFFLLMICSPSTELLEQEKIDKHASKKLKHAIKHDLELVDNNMLAFMMKVLIYLFDELKEAKRGKMFKGHQISKTNFIDYLGILKINKGIKNITGKNNYRLATIRYSKEANIIHSKEIDSLYKRFNKFSKSIIGKEYIKSSS